MRTHLIRVLFSLAAVIAILSIFAAAFPVACVAVLIWCADVYNRKPFWAAFIALAWGALGATLWSIIGSGIAIAVLENMTDGTTVEFISAVVFAPVVEEFFKGIILIALLLIPRGYESATNGLVYGCMIGLGFAITENFLYYMSSYYEAGIAAWVATIIVRTLLTTFVHVMATGTTGAALGFGASRGHHPLEMVFLGLGGYSVAIVIHGVWNLTATLSEYTNPIFFLIGILCFLFAFAILLCSALASIMYDRRILQQEFDEETRLGVLSVGDSIVLSNFTKRNALQYLFPGRLQDDYKKAAIRLAVIKRQNRSNPTLKREQEIEYLRQLIRQIQNQSTFYHPKRPQNPYDPNSQPLEKFSRHVALRSSDLPRREDPTPGSSLPVEHVNREPHSITALNPLEFRSRVRRSHQLDRGAVTPEDQEEEEKEA